jgi:hypothetical protein
MDKRQNPELRRYDSVRGVPAIYVVAAGDVVKVGKAGSTRSRLRELHSDFKRRGMSPWEFVVFEAPYDQIDGLERAAIRTLRTMAVQFGGTNEYFTDISFDDAACAVAEIVLALPPRP